MKTHVVCLLLALALPFQALSNQGALAQQNDALAVLISDAYASENKNKRYTVEVKAKRQHYQISILTVEGLYGGNSFHQYLAVYKPTRKMIDPVTFEGEIKYRLLGFLPLATDGRSWVDTGSIQLNDNTLSLNVQNLKNSQDTQTRHIEINRNSVRLMN